MIGRAIDFSIGGPHLLVDKSNFAGKTGGGLFEKVMDKHNGYTAWRRDSWAAGRLGGKATKEPLQLIAILDR